MSEAPDEPGRSMNRPVAYGNRETSFNLFLHESALSEKRFAPNPTIRGETIYMRHARYS